MVTLRQPGAVAVGATLALAGALQVLAGFNEPPADHQTIMLVIAASLSGLAGWWSTGQTATKILHPGRTSSKRMVSALARTGLLHRRHMPIRYQWVRPDIVEPVREDGR